MFNFIEKSDSTDPYENLAYESALAEFIRCEIQKGKSCYGMFLWRSDSAIVFGRNQNIRNECKINLAKKKGIKLVRRKTGGGAVYHDLGNLNFSFLASKDIYSKEKNFDIILKALSRLGLRAEISGRNDILVNGKKISGNAYSIEKGVCIHHGTLLVNLDTTLAACLLTPPETKFKSKGIVSVKSRIINLKDISPNVDIQTLGDKVIEAFDEAFDSETEDIEINKDYYQKCLNKLVSEEWININAIDCEVLVESDIGFFKFSVEEDNGIIKKIFYESDILEVELIEHIIGGLVEVTLDEESIFEKYQHLISTSPFSIPDKVLDAFNKIVVAIINCIK